MDSRDVLRIEIERLEGQLRPLKEALAELNRLADIEAIRNIPEGPDTKYANMRPLLAIQAVLKEHGKPMRKAELTEILMKGGIAYGKKRAGTNVEMGIRVALEAGSLTMTGKDELIGLPEWSKKR
jgi:hypothetical protein